MDTKSEKDLDLLNDLPTLPRVEGTTVVSDATLKPLDGGFGAWSFLLSAFAVESIVWGLPVSYGVFLAAYLKDPAFSNQPHAASLLPLIGPLCTGLMYISGLVLYPLIGRYPHIRQRLAWAGTIICWASLFAASYVKEIKALLVLQGVCYGLGGALLYAPCISFLSEWWVVRRGLANGVLTAGTSIGGLVLPIVLPIPIERWGTAVALRGLSVALLVILGPIMPFIRGRGLEARVATASKQVHPSQTRSWLRDVGFWILMVMNTVQSFAYYLPAIWLPTFAATVGVSTRDAALAVALLNGASALGRLVLGRLSDRTDAWFLAPLTCALASGCVLTLWGAAPPVAGTLLAFGALYGLIAGAWFSLWAALLRPIAGDDPALTTTLYGYLLLSTGLGSVISTPIATALARVPHGVALQVGVGRPTSGFAAADARFKSMIVYVGVCFAATAAVGAFGWATQRRRWQKGGAV